MHHFSPSGKSSNTNFRGELFIWNLWLNAQNTHAPPLQSAGGVSSESNHCGLPVGSLVGEKVFAGLKGASRDCMGAWHRQQYLQVFHNTMYYSEKQDYTFIYFFIYHAELKGSSTVWHSKLSISRWILKITEKNGRLLTKQLVRLNIIIKMFVEPAPLKRPCFIKTDVGEADVPSTSSRLSLQMCWRS